MLPWISSISSYQNKEKKLNSSSWIQLATVAIDNTPRVRTVVFRGWTDSYEMKIITDIRSDKISELKSNKNVEICWLFNKSRCQFRFRGSATIDLGPDTYYQWKKLDIKSKSMWSWPSPGKRYDPSQFENKFSMNCDDMDNFILLKINISHVDQLLLAKPFHIRKRWLKNNNWKEERINP
tara:strand:+ start:4707 stop:5246 length:540 start_codon:yes stop_codon:yes gene_type:complete